MDVLNLMAMAAQNPIFALKVDGAVSYTHLAGLAIDDVHPAHIL